LLKKKGQSTNPDCANCALFERIVDDAYGYEEYLECSPQALLWPAAKEDTTPAPAGAVDGPWIVALGDFVSAAETAALMAAINVRWRQARAESRVGGR
jgi:hypothetical protein